MGIKGIKFSLLAHIEEVNVDRIKKSIETYRGTYRIIEPLYSAMTDNGYYEEFKNRNEESKYFIKPYNTKHTKDSPITYQHVNRVFSKLNEEYSKINPDNRIQLLPMTIWRSGLFNTLYEIEYIKGDVTSDDFKEVSEVYGNKNTYSSYVHDYELYKEVFWGSS